jgi:hypothetical protein
MIASELQDLLDSRLRGLVRVEQPLLLITQVQRSGGTLLLRLLDGHPECHVAPFQLRGIDAAAKDLPRRADEAWQALYDEKLAHRFRSGHRQRKHDVLRHEDVFPFRLPPELQRALYEACAGTLDDPTPRDLLDCYFTSYFNAWLDYRNLRTGPKRWVVGFEPAVSRSIHRRIGLRELYPDGLVLSVARDPWSWYASARRWEPRWSDRERALDHWCKAATGVLKWKKRKKGTKKGGVRVLTFDDLLSKTEETMRKLAGVLEIEFRPELLEPTFNGEPIPANTSFADVETEVSTKPLERARDELSRDDLAFIDERAGEIYERLLKRAAKDWT